jgi:hypothetical protein
MPVTDTAVSRTASPRGRGGSRDEAAQGVPRAPQMTGPVAADLATIGAVSLKMPWTASSNASEMPSPHACSRPR